MKEDAKIFLCEESLEALEASKGAKILVQFPKEIESTQAEISKMKAERKDVELNLEELQKGYEDLFKLSFKQRFMKGKQIKAEKADYAMKIGILARRLASIDSLMSDHENYVSCLKTAINEFMKTLERINVEPKDVVAEYHRIKEMLERKERGELVEPAIEVQQPAKAEKKNDAVPEQNRKTYPKLTQRQKFEMRLAKTAKRSNGPDPTCMGPQNG